MIWLIVIEAGETQETIEEKVAESKSGAALCEKRSGIKFWIHDGQGKQRRDARRQ